MSEAISKAEYLKRYLSGGNDSAKTKKKKSKKPKSTGTGIQIFEEDAFQAVTTGAKPDMDSDMEEEIQIEAEIKKKVDDTRAKFRSAFQTVDEPIVKKEPASPPDTPPRQNRRNSTSPPRRKRRDSDTSPPRRQRRDSDASPPRRQRRDSDASPPRKQRRGSPSPPRRNHRDSDASPPRRQQRRSSPSPPRRQRRDSDTSPRRKVKEEVQDTDNSPPRQRTRRDSDNSPPRRGALGADSSPPRRRRLTSPRPGQRRAVTPQRIKEEPQEEEEEQEDGQLQPATTLDGRRAGLQSASDLREEGQMVRSRELEMFTNMAAEISGRGAATVTRQKMVGRGRDKPEDKERKEREAAKQAELTGKYEKWNKGVAQLEGRAAQLEEMARVAAEPLARSADDEQMNEHLKQELDMKEDPMANMILAKRRNNDIKRGRLVYPQYNGPFPPNRFGLAPGYRWDGVVRGNGFEGKLAVNDNRRQAKEREYYEKIQTYE